MATPSPSPSPSPPPEPPSSKPKAKKLHPVPWTHHETIHLIQAYQEKWYSLKRGQLKANQWQEVATTVAARCGYDYNLHPTKTVIQCRHKMEKLRKRYREEQRRMSVTGLCSWQYFELMDSLDRGTPPILARPLALIPPNDTEEDDEDDSEEEAEQELEEEEEGENYGYRSKSRSINYILRKPTIVNRFAGNGSGLLPPAKKGKREEMAAAVKIVEAEVVEEEEEVVRLDLAGEIRAFTERMMGMERKKMEIMKETEKWRMDMENKKIEMILDSQKKIVGMISATFGLKEV